MNSGLNTRLETMPMRVLELRDMVAKKEEQRERAFRKEKNEDEREEKMNTELKKEKLMNEKKEPLDNREFGPEERELQWWKRKFEEERRKRLLDESSRVIEGLERKIDSKMKAKVEIEKEKKALEMKVERLEK